MLERLKLALAGVLLIWLLIAGVLFVVDPDFRLWIWEGFTSLGDHSDLPGCDRGLCF